MILDIKKCALLAFFLGTLCGTALADCLFSPPEDQLAVSENIKSKIHDRAGMSQGDTLKFFLSLKKAVQCNDKTFISQNMQYPLVVHLYGKNLRVKSSSQFVKSYDRIFDKRLKTIVLSQKFNDQIVTQYGIGMGHGNLWYGQRITKAGELLPIKITAINND